MKFTTKTGVCPDCGGTGIYSAMSEVKDCSTCGAMWGEIVIVHSDPSIFKVDVHTYRYRILYGAWERRLEDSPGSRAVAEKLTAYRREWLEWTGGDAGDLHDLAVGIEKPLP